jgi:hypothetical protein
VTKLAAVPPALQKELHIKVHHKTSAPSETFPLGLPFGLNFFCTTTINEPATHITLIANFDPAFKSPHLAYGQYMQNNFSCFFPYD